MLNPLTGHVFERSLIETYISENSKDPISGEDMTLDDLIPITGTNVVRPRPPALTSIPALLSAFQSEWDAMALETFSLRQQLLETRQELSSTLYHYDASIRVIARLSSERDEARDALAKLSSTIGQNGSGSSEGKDIGSQMEVDVPQSLIDAIAAKQSELTASRKIRMRQLPQDLASVDTVKSFTQKSKSKQLFTSVSHLSLDSSGSFVISGGGRTTAGVYSIVEQSLTASFKTLGIVTDVKWWNDDSIIIATKTGQLQVFEISNPSTAKLSLDNIHSAAIVGIALLPIGNVILTASSDKSWAAHDLESQQTLFTIHSDNEFTSIAVHPDGALVALGSTDGSIYIYEIAKGSVVATFENGSEAGSVNNIEFSENGYWLVSSCSEVEGAAQVWDLRTQAQTQTLAFESLSGTPISALSFDYSGRYLAAATPKGIQVAYYDRPSKSWQLDVFFDNNTAIDVAWGPNAQSLVAITSKGSISTFSS